MVRRARTLFGLMSAVVRHLAAYDYTRHVTAVNVTAAGVWLCAYHLYGAKQHLLDMRYTLRTVDKAVWAINLETPSKRKWDRGFNTMLRIEEEIRALRKRKTGDISMGCDPSQQSLGSEIID